MPALRTLIYVSRVLIFPALFFAGSVMIGTLTAERAESKSFSIAAATSPKAGELLISQAKPTFSDVSSSAWASQHIQGLAARGIIAGYQGKFRPQDPMTRVEFAVLLSKAFPRPPVRQFSGFLDVSKNYWGYEAIRLANVTGFLSGNGKGQFQPNQNISRQEVLLALVSGLGYKPTAQLSQTISTYQDAKAIPTWAVNPIAAATENQLVVNYPNVKILNPNRAATRAEVAAMVYQALAQRDKMPRISSNYVPLLASYASNGKCTDADISHYVSRLRQFTPFIYSERDLSEGVRNPNFDGTFDRAAFQQLISCGQASVLTLVSEIWVTHINDASELKAYNAIVSAALAQIGSDAVPTLVQILKNPSTVYPQAPKEQLPKAYVGAILGLIAIGPQASAAVPTLANALETDKQVAGYGHVNFPYYAALALSSIGKDAVPALIQLLKTDKKGAAITALGDIGPAAAAAELDLTKVLKNGSGSASSAAIALGKIKANPSVVVPLILEKLEKIDKQKLSRDSPSPENYILALSYYGSDAKAAVPLLINHLTAVDSSNKPDDSSIATVIAYALGKIGSPDKRAISPLIRILLKTAPLMRSDPESSRLPCTVATTLGELGQGSEPDLQPLLNHPNSRVKVLAAHSLASIRGEIPNELIEHSSDWLNLANSCGASLRLTARVLPALIKLNKDNDQRLKKLAIAGLATIDPSAADQQVTSNLESAALYNDDASTRALAIQALSFRGIRSKELINTLLTVLQNDKNYNVRQQAALALVGRSVSDYLEPTAGGLGGLYDWFCTVFRC